MQSFEQEDGLKLAAKNYQIAAGAFQYIKDNALTATRQDCTFDLYPDSLNLLSALMLAQAQEVFYIKAVKGLLNLPSALIQFKNFFFFKDKMKDLTVSKIAAQCSDFYAEALKSIQVDFLKDMQKVKSNIHDLKNFKCFLSIYSNGCKQLLVNKHYFMH